MLDFLILAALVLVLAKSASVVVDNIMKLSDFFGLGQLAVGFILLSTATSLPEFSVGVISSVSGEGAISAGNVFGSNVADILLVLGIIAFIGKIVVKREELNGIALVLLLTSLITIYVIFTSGLGRLEGLVLLLVFVVYAFYLLQSKRGQQGVGSRVSKREALSAFLWFCFGIAVVLVSSGLTVEFAVKVVKSFGLAPSFIGATVIAVGTSLPELSVDLAAARKKKYGIVIGDAVGSCMTNITLVLGTSALIHPMFFGMKVFLAVLLFALAANILLFYFASTTKKFGRREGAVMLLFYLVYLAVISGAQYVQLS